VLFKADLERWRDTMDVILTISRPKEGETCVTGRVTDHIPGLDIPNTGNTAAIVVGPPPLMRSTAAELLRRDIPEQNIWLSQERKMCCGLGKCGHCRVGGTYICLDGPVFRYADCKNMLD
jgi:anaerobic sulfite reductase subunit B